MWLELKILFRRFWKAAVLFCFLLAAAMMAVATNVTPVFRMLRSRCFVRFFFITTPTPLRWQDDG